MPKIKLLAFLPCVHKVRFDYCQFGAPWKKHTTIMFFGNAFFEQNGSVCAVRGSEICPIICAPHIPLSGHVKNGNAKQSFRTSVAEPYPPALCAKWAQLITDDYSTRKNCSFSNVRPVSSLVKAFHGCPSRSKASSPPPPSHYLIHFPKHWM